MPTRLASSQLRNWCARNAGGERHGAIHLINSAEGQSAGGFDLLAGMIALDQSGVPRVYPEGAGYGDHQNYG